MLKHLCIALAVLIASTVSAMAHDHPIVTRLQEFVAFYNAGDAEAVGRFYTETGTLLPPGQPALIGRAAIAGHYAKAFAAGVGELGINVLEIVDHGPDTAVEIGETRVKLNGQEIYGRYLHVWVREDDQWLLSRDIYQVLSGP
ncbi:MAG: SgcJ/EcaC family oxidoreductase [Rhodobacter sp.]|nr:SgcJ/EcaC family oxidoreductase [Rhodobacter sp.]